MRCVGNNWENSSRWSPNVIDVLCSYIVSTQKYQKLNTNVYKIADVLKEIREQVII